MGDVRVEGDGVRTMKQRHQYRESGAMCSPQLTLVGNLLISLRDIFRFLHVPINISTGVCVQQNGNISEGLWEINLPPPLTVQIC